MDDKQAATRQVYEDSKFVAAFVAKNGAVNTIDISPHIQEFTSHLRGNRIIDVGCGPGSHARQFAELGFSVVAIDYSEAMIRAAQDSSTTAAILYRHLDMRQIGESFAAGSFDGAWVSASLIHVPESDVPQVLAGFHKILVPNGIARITLKAGTQGPKVISDDKYGLIVKREFIFWEEGNFTRLLREAGFEVTNIEIEKAGITGTEPTTWLRFVARAIK